MRRPSFRKTVKCVSSVSTLTTEIDDLDAKVPKGGEGEKIKKLRSLKRSPEPIIPHSVQKEMIERFLAFIAKACAIKLGSSTGASGEYCLIRLISLWHS